jgi:hypothetical protein
MLELPKYKKNNHTPDTVVDNFDERDLAPLTTENSTVDFDRRRVILLLLGVGGFAVTVNRLGKIDIADTLGFSSDIARIQKIGSEHILEYRGGLYIYQVETVRDNDIGINQLTDRVNREYGNVGKEGYVPDRTRNLYGALDGFDLEMIDLGAPQELTAKRGKLPANFREGGKYTVAVFIDKGTLEGMALELRVEK